MIGTALALLEIVVPVFLVVGAGYVGVRLRYVARGDGRCAGPLWRDGRRALPAFPRDDRGSTSARSVHPLALIAFFGAGTACFLGAMLCSRRIWRRRPGESVAVGFATFFPQRRHARHPDRRAGLRRAGDGRRLRHHRLPLDLQLLRRLHRDGAGPAGPRQPGRGAPPRLCHHLPQPADDRPRRRHGLQPRRRRPARRCVEAALEHGGRCRRCRSRSSRSAAC